MTELGIILGSAGVLLVLAGLIGGGFSFAGNAVPTVGKAVRVPCFVVGGLLVLTSISLAFMDGFVPDVVVYTGTSGSATGSR